MSEDVDDRLELVRRICSPLPPPCSPLRRRTERLLEPDTSIIGRMNKRKRRQRRRWAVRLATRCCTEVREAKGAKWHRAFPHSGMSATPSGGPAARIGRRLVGERNRSYVEDGDMECNNTAMKFCILETHSNLGQRSSDMLSFNLAQWAFNMPMQRLQRTRYTCVE